mmetsp:Transcript_73671/g.204865  ORF Transcript_73671/g.204865 Transcript_73671/m.204865 type:complete len:222 (+) Transcript_73671:521-1186(+)
MSCKPCSNSRKPRSTSLSLVSSTTVSRCEQSACALISLRSAAASAAQSIQSPDVPHALEQSEALLIKWCTAPPSTTMASSAPFSPGNSVVTLLHATVAWAAPPVTTASATDEATSLMRRSAASIRATTSPTCWQTRETSCCDAKASAAFSVRSRRVPRPTTCAHTRLSCSPSSRMALSPTVPWSSNSLVRAFWGVALPRCACALHSKRRTRSCTVSPRPST